MVSKEIYISALLKVVTLNMWCIAAFVFAGTRTIISSLASESQVKRLLTRIFINRSWYVGTHICKRHKNVGSDTHHTWLHCGEDGDTWRVLFSKVLFPSYYAWIERGNSAPLTSLLPFSFAHLRTAQFSVLNTK